jgi:integrase
MLGVVLGVIAMATSLNRLSARTIATVTEPGRHADGGNLYLLVSKTGAKSWVFMYRFKGGQRELGLGSLRDVPLASARRKAASYREALAAGTDPRSLRADTASPTFAVAATELIESLRPSWRNQKHAAQWESTIEQYCVPLLKLRADEIAVDDVLKALKPIWQKIPETAARVRMRIERVLDYARAKNWRTGENPARWKGHLDHILPPRKRLTCGHHKAMPHRDVAKLVRRLQDLGSVSAMALEFCILTAARSGEVLNARWEEFDLEEGVWTVPAARMKAGREHRVPLAKRPVEILKELNNSVDSDFVFAGSKQGRPLSVMSMTMVMRRLKQPYTVHGFRSAFRDWASEETSFPREVAEQALAHVVESAVERAYRRSDLFEKRRHLMEAWEAYALPSSAMDTQ